MRHWLWRTAFALFAGAAVFGGAARAQDMPYPPTSAPQLADPQAADPPAAAAPVAPAPVVGPQAVIPPPGPYATVARWNPQSTASWFGYGPVEVAETTPRPPRQPIHNWLHKCNIGCYENIAYPGCGSLKSECTYIFGSCHAFYAEPCWGTPYKYWPLSWGPNPKGCNCP